MEWWRWETGSDGKPYYIISYNDVLAVKCPLCRRKIGKDCRETGTVMDDAKAPHQERLKAAAERIGLYD